MSAREVLSDLYEAVTGDRDKNWPAGWMAVKIGWEGNPREVRMASDLLTEITGRLDPMNERDIVANTREGDIPKQYKYGAGFPISDKQATLLEAEPPKTVALMRDLVLFLQTAEVGGLQMNFDFDTAVRLSTEGYGNPEFTSGYTVIIISEGTLTQFIAGYLEAADVEEYIHTMFTKIGKLHGFEWDLIDHVTIGFNLAPPRRRTYRSRRRGVTRRRK